MDIHNIELRITANTSKRFILITTGEFANDEDFHELQYSICNFLSTQLTGLNGLPAIMN
jgi:hypothetical protein